MEIIIYISNYVDRQQFGLSIDVRQDWFARLGTESFGEAVLFGRIGNLPKWIEQIELVSATNFIQTNIFTFQSLAIPSVEKWSSTNLRKFRGLRRRQNLVLFTFNFWLSFSLSSDDFSVPSFDVDSSSGSSSHSNSSSVVIGSRPLSSQPFKSSTSP